MHQDGRNSDYGDPVAVADTQSRDDEPHDELELTPIGAPAAAGEHDHPGSSYPRRPERELPDQPTSIRHSQPSVGQPVRVLRREDVYAPVPPRGVPRVLKSRARRQEDELDRDLAASARRVTRPNVITFNSSQGGVGKSALAFGLGDALSGPPARLNVVAVDIDHDSGALPDLAGDDARCEHTLMDLLAEHGRLGQPRAAIEPGEPELGSDRRARPAAIPFALLRRFTSPTPSGMLIVAGPRLPEDRRRLSTGQLDTALALLGGADVIILDCGAGITSERARWAIRTADQRVMLARPRFTGTASTARAFSDGVPVENTWLVLNRVVSRRGQNLEHIRRAFTRADLDNPIEVPESPQLEAAMERASYRLQNMPSHVRLPIKQLAVRVAEALQ